MGAGRARVKGIKFQTETLPGAFDFFITFSKIIEPTTGVNSIEDQCVVRMSPQQFKNIIDYATKALDAWEASFGVIQTTTKLQSADAINESFRKLKEAVNK